MIGAKGGLGDVVRRLTSRDGIGRGVFGVGAMQGVKLVATLAVAALLARALGPEGYGLFMHISSLVFVAAVPVAAGLPNLLVRETARYDHEGRWDLLAGLLRRSHQFVALASFLIVLPACLFALWQMRGSDDPYWPVFAISIWIIPFLALSGLRAGLLKGLRMPMQGNSPEFFARPLAYLALVMGIIVAGRTDPVNASWAQLGSVATSFLVGALILRKFGAPALSKAKPAFDDRVWLRAWLPFTLLAGVTTANLQIGLVLMGWLTDDVQAGYFAIGITIANVIMLPLQVVNIVVAPHFARSFQQGDKARLQSLAHDAARLALLAGAPLSLGFVVLGPQLIEWGFGTEYAPAYLPLLWLAGGQLVNVVAGSAGQLLNMSGNERVTTCAIVVGLLINIGLCILLVPKFGAVGAAMAGAASVTSWNLLMVIAAWRRTGVRSLAL